MKQKGMAILMAVLLAAGTMPPVYAAEEVFSIEAVYVGESQKDSPPPAPKPEQQREEKSVSQPQKKKIKVVVVKRKETTVQTSPEVQNEVKKITGQTAQDTEEFPYTLESFAEEVLRLTNEARAEAEIGRAHV